MKRLTLKELSILQIDIELCLLQFLPDKTMILGSLSHVEEFAKVLG